MFCFFDELKAACLAGTQIAQAITYNTDLTGGYLTPARVVALVLGDIRTGISCILNLALYRGV